MQLPPSSRTQKLAVPWGKTYAEFFFTAFPTPSFTVLVTRRYSSLRLLTNVAVQATGAREVETSSPLLLSDSPLNKIQNLAPEDVLLGVDVRHE